LIHEVLASTPVPSDPNEEAVNGHNCVYIYQYRNLPGDRCVAMAVNRLNQALAAQDSGFRYFAAELEEDGAWVSIVVKTAWPTTYDWDS
jgi:hypothetical protein